MAKKPTLGAAFDRHAEDLKPKRRKKPTTPTSGPRGGQSTVTPGGFIRKSVFFDAETSEAIRREAFDRQVSESDLVRQAVRDFLDLK